MVVEMHEKLRREGFAVVPCALDETNMSALESSLERVGDRQAVRRRGGVYAIRNLLDVVPEARELACSAAVLSLVEPLLGRGCFVVRGILFDKMPSAPWKVAWHQDLSIAVRERVETRGFGPWSEKSGVTHVQPPAQILERMLAVRLHLDDCDEANGALKVLPGSHLDGRLDEGAIRRWRESVPAVACIVPRGGALLMKPLLLHSSPSPLEPRRRRVIHLEFASEPLLGGLEWKR